MSGPHPQLFEEIRARIRQGRITEDDRNELSKLVEALEQATELLVFCLGDGERSSRRRTSRLKLEEQ